MEKYWVNWSELNSILLSTKKKIVLFGRSEDWIPKALKKISKKKILICDSNKFYDNKEFDGVKIFHKSKFFKNPKKYFFIISTGSYESVIYELRKKNLQPGNDFVCLPDFYDFAFLDNLRKKSGKIIISSSDQMKKKATRYSLLGGGIFELTFDEKSSIIRKKINGSFRQICRLSKNKYAANEYSGRIIIFDNNFKKIKMIKTNIKNMCGLAYIDDKEVLVTTSQTSDCFYLICINKGKILKRYDFSSKENEHDSKHHLNDILYYDKQIFFTFFSSTGHWKNGLFNGGLGSLNLRTSKIDIITNNSIQPHTPREINGAISYCDSGNARVEMGGQQKNIEFEGFIRGLESYKNYVFVGQSETMYLTRMQRIGKNINISSGIYMVDVENNCKRFLSTQGICNIHDLLVKDLK